MSGGDGTGPWWAQRRIWRCWVQPSGFRHGYQKRYWSRYHTDRSEVLTRDEQKRMLRDELDIIDREKQEIEKKLHELESGKEDD